MPFIRTIKVLLVSVYVCVYVRDQSHSYALQTIKRIHEENEQTNNMKCHKLLFKPNPRFVVTETFFQWFFHTSNSSMMHANHLIYSAQCFVCSFIFFVCFFKKYILLDLSNRWIWIYIDVKICLRNLYPWNQSQSQQIILRLTVQVVYLACRVHCRPRPSWTNRPVNWLELCSSNYSIVFLAILLLRVLQCK